MHAPAAILPTTPGIDASAELPGRALARLADEKLPEVTLVPHRRGTVPALGEVRVRGGGIAHRELAVDVRV
jgi:hypothetical protein